MESLKNYIDRIVCINLVTAHQRRENIKYQFKELGFENDLEFYNAISFKNIKFLEKPLNDLLNSGIISASFYNMNIGSFGCAFSHYSILKESYELGYNSVMIIEDDICLLKNRDIILDYFRNLPKDWDYLYLTPGFCHNIENKFTFEYINASKEKWVKLNDPRCKGYDEFFDINYVIKTTAYHLVGWISTGCRIFNRKAMKLYIDEFEKMQFFKNADHMKYFNHDFKDSGLNIYTTNIRLFAHEEEIDRLAINDDNTISIIPKIGSISIPTCINVNSSNFFNIHSNSLIKEND